jgi:hypothetical protein
MLTVEVHQQGRRVNLSQTVPKLRHRVAAAAAAENSQCVLLRLSAWFVRACMPPV